MSYLDFIFAGILYVILDIVLDIDLDFNLFQFDDPIPQPKLDNF